MRKPKLLFIGLNPAWQKTLTCKGFSVNRVNRAAAVHAMASGKGVNALRAARQAGADGKVVQFAGGDTGARLLADMQAEQLESLTVSCSASTRVCTTILDPRRPSTTEIIEPSGIISAEELMRLKHKISKAIETADGIAVCGTYPPGVPPDFYADIITAAKDGIPVMLDAHKNVHDALMAGPAILKINAPELHALTGCGKALKAGLHKLFATYPLKAVAITDGAATAYLGTPCGCRSFQIPALPRVLNPIGAGDTATAVMMTSLCRGILQGQATVPLQTRKKRDTDFWADCFADGLAAASASCLTPRPAVYDAEAAADIRKQINIAPLTLKPET